MLCSEHSSLFWHYFVTCSSDQIVILEQQMQWSEEKGMKMLREVIAEGVFQYKSGSRERGNAWRYVVTTPNAFEGLVITGRTVRDRLTHVIRKFSSRINAEKNLLGQGGEHPTEYHILLQDILDLSMIVMLNRT